MARIFNIYFQYKDMDYHAVVSVRATPFFTEYTLNNINQNLMDMLPGNKIISKGKDHFIFSNFTDKDSPVLMNAIIKAVAEHLHSVHS